MPFSGLFAICSSRSSIVGELGICGVASLSGFKRISNSVFFCCNSGAVYCKVDYSNAFFCCDCWADYYFGSLSGAVSGFGEEIETMLRL